jgi:hypothetical protein
MTTSRLPIARLLAALAVGAALLAPGFHPAPPAGAAIPDCDAEPPPTDPICNITTTTSAPPPPPGPIAREVLVHGPDPAARPAAEAYLDEVLDQVRPANRAALAGRTVRLHVIPAHRPLTEFGPWTEHRGQQRPDPYPDDGYDDARPWDALRGHTKCGPLAAGVGAERVTRVSATPYLAATDAQLGQTLFHEAGHLVHCSFSDDQDVRLATLFAAALTRERDTVVGADPDYISTSKEEYFADATVAWFEAGEHESYRRSWLQVHDPGLLDLLGTIYGTPPPVRRCGDVRATAVLRTAGTFTGGPGRDVVSGSTGRDTIAAAGGADLVCGSGGADELHGDAGNDEIDAGAGADTVHGGDGQDSIDGGSSADVIHGDAGNDKLRGRQGADDLHGDDGDDELHGGDGDDRYSGGEGDDWLNEDLNHEGAVELGLGDDHMFGGPGDDSMSASVGDDTFLDTLGTDQMVGGEGNDEMYAVDVTDPRLPPVTPPDHLYGTSGNDACTADPFDIVDRCFPPGEA